MEQALNPIKRWLDTPITFVLIPVRKDISPGFGEETSLMAKAMKCHPLLDQASEGFRAVHGPVLYGSSALLTCGLTIKSNRVTLQNHYSGLDRISGMSHLLVQVSSQTLCFLNLF